MKHNTFNLSGVSRDTWVRLIILIATLINMGLNALGITNFPNEAINEWYDVISVVVIMASALWCAWKNNSFTVNAQKADEFLNHLADAIEDVYTEEEVHDE
jgi:SPP1 family holin